MIPAEAWEAVRWHREFSRLRVLPFGGSDLMDQPAYVYEAIEAVDSASMESEREAQRRAEKAQEEQRIKVEKEAQKGRRR